MKGKKVYFTILKGLAMCVFWLYLYYLCLQVVYWFRHNLNFKINKSFEQNIAYKNCFLIIGDKLNSILVLCIIKYLEIDKCYKVYFLLLFLHIPYRINNIFSVYTYIYIWIKYYNTQINVLKFI